MKTVCVLTTFNSYDASYSLNLVAEDQIKMLLIGGYKPILIVNEGFEPKGAYADERVEIEKVFKATASNDGILPSTWKDEVKKLEVAYQEIFEKHKVDVVITHDLISQPAALVNNMAGREVAKKMPKISWKNFVHSVFSSNVESNILEVSKAGRMPWPNSNLVFPNSYDRSRLARNFNVEEPTVLTVPHPTDVLSFFDFENPLRKIIEDKNVLDKEVVLVYPCRLDNGKQPHVIIEIAAALKRLGTSVCAIIVDFASTGGAKVDYRNSMKDLAVERGLNDEEAFFLSEQDPVYKYSGTKKTISNLFSISNVFVLPSKSETYSLVAQESALCGNFMILNFDFPVMREIYGSEHPKFFKFSSNIDINTGMDGATNTEYSDPLAYYEDIARYVKFTVRNDRVLAMKTKIRRERNLAAVFRNYFEPMLYSD